MVVLELLIGFCQDDRVILHRPDDDAGKCRFCTFIEQPVLPVKEDSVLSELILCCSHTDQLLGEHGERRQIWRGLPGKPEAVALAEIRHGLFPVQGG